MKKVLLAAILLVAFSFGYSSLQDKGSVTNSVQAAEKKQLRNNCDRLYSLRKFKGFTKRQYKNRLRKDIQLRRIQEINRCQTTARHQHMAREMRYRWWDKRKVLWIWKIRWRLKIAEWERNWSWSTAYCETGGTMNPNIHSPGGTYHGLGQFSWKTGQAAGFNGDPHLASFYEQLMRMVWWLRKTNDEQWPVCGD